ncbi:TPA: hypothetical protein ACH3X1_015579 [Trebouxia sp. C0004]
MPQADSHQTPQQVHCPLRHDDLYVVNQLQHGSTIQDEFTVYSSNKFKSAFQASAWAITIWQHSRAKSVKQRLAGNPLQREGCLQ